MSLLEARLNEMRMAEYERRLLDLESQQKRQRGRQRPRRQRRKSRKYDQNRSKPDESVRLNQGMYDHGFDDPATDVSTADNHSSSLPHPAPSHSDTHQPDTPTACRIKKRREG